MNLRILLHLTLLGMIASAEAQTLAAAEASKPVAGNEMTAEESVNLPAGKLGDLVGEIERRLPSWPRKKDAAPWVWPNLVYAPAVINRDVLALRLRHVEPIEALALLAAAAGCKLDPVFAPKDSPEAVGQRVIGYRFELDETAALPRVAVALAGLAGAPPQVRTVGGSGAGNDQDSAGSPTENQRPIVRVYAVGSLLTGSKDDVAKKTERLQTLIALAVRTSEPASRRSAPELAFHAESQALIAKATAGQHELLTQVIQAMKENEAH